LSREFGSDAGVDPASAPRCNRCHARAGSYAVTRAGVPRALCARCLARSPAVMKRAALTALVVGTVLTALNQGDAIVRGDLSSALLWKVPLTYCVPYLVTTWGALSRPN